MFRFARLEPFIIAIVNGQAVSIHDVADVVIPDTFPYIDDGMFEQRDLVESNGLPMARYRRVIARSDRRRILPFSTDPTSEPGATVLEFLVAMVPNRVEHDGQIPTSVAARLKEAIADSVRRMSTIDSATFVESMVGKVWDIILHARAAYAEFYIDGMRQIVSSLLVDGRPAALTSIYIDMFSPWECAFDAALSSLSAAIDMTSPWECAFDAALSSLSAVTTESKEGVHMPSLSADARESFRRYAQEMMFLSPASVARRVQDERDARREPDDPFEDGESDGGSSDIIDDPFNPFVT